MVLPDITGDITLRNRFFNGDKTLSEDLRNKLKESGNGYDIDSIVSRFEFLLKDVRKSKRIPMYHAMYFSAACQMWNSTTEPDGLVYH